MKFDMPFVHQASQVLCWEACAQMMWMWKHLKSPDQRYSRVVDQYRKVNAGMDWNSLNSNIFIPLGMQGKINATSSDLHRELAFSPCTITLPYIPSGSGSGLGSGSGHAVVILELDAASQDYLVVDPMSKYQPGKVMCSAYAIREFVRTVDSKMGNFVWYWASGPYC